jgi:hypothetical protein
MRKLIGLGLATALTAAVVAMPASAQTTTKFSVLGITVEQHRTQNGFAFRDRLVQPGDRDDVVGSDKVRCAQLSRAKVHCRGVFFFPNGKVKAIGDISFRKHLNKIHVVGGTRAYNGVGGKVIVHIAEHRDTLLDFTLVK